MWSLPICEKFLTMERALASVIESFVMPDGINIWPHLRVATDSDFALLPPDAYRKNNLTIRTHAQQCLRELPPAVQTTLARAPRQSCLIVGNPGLYTERVQGKLYDPYLDPVAQTAATLGLQPIKLVLVGTVLDDALIPPLQISPLFASKPIPVESLPPIPGYADYVQACLAHCLPVLHWLRVTQLWLDTSVYAALYENILSLMEPCMVVLECYYAAPFMGLAQACRKLNIPCVEYQHGMQSGPHIPYCFEYLPGRGYDVVPELFFHWGEASATAMQQRLARQNFHKALVAGKPSYGPWKKGWLPEEPERLARFEARIHNRIPIAVPLPINGIGLELLEAAIAQAPPEWLWLLRQHPLNVQPEAAALAARYPERIETEDCSALRLYTVLERSRHMVAGFSSSVLEAFSLFNLDVTCIVQAAEVYYTGNISKGRIAYETTVELVC